MAALYVTEQGAKVCQRGKRIVVEKEGVELCEIEMHRLESLLLYGNIQVTTQALHALLAEGIELALLSLGGRLLGQLTPPMARNITLRLRQHTVFSDPERCLSLARALVRTKIRNSLEVLKQADWNSGAGTHREARTRLERASARAARAGTLDELCGMEGAAASAAAPSR